MAGDLRSPLRVGIQPSPSRQVVTPLPEREALNEQPAEDESPYSIMRANTVRPYELGNIPCPHTNKPNLKAPLSKGSWRRQASEGL